MKHSCKLMFYKYFSADEMYAAIDMLKWFEEESMSGKVRWDVKKKAWITDPGLILPSWKHLTRGGHKNGFNIQRGAPGTYVRGGNHNKETWAGLIFRRHSRDQRIFVVQRAEDLIIPLDLKFRIEKRICICRECIGPVKAKTKLTLDDLQLYKELP